MHNLSLDTWRLNWLTEPTAAAVFEHDVLIAATPGALQRGLTLGMRCATARSLAPECLLYPRDPAAEHSAYAQAAQAALAYSPSVYQHTGDIVLLEATYSLRLFGGVRPIVQGLRKKLKLLKLQVRSSVAPTARGAWLLAQAAVSPTRYACGQATLERLLSRVPCAALPSAKPHLVWLNALGCETLRGLRALPRKGLQRRVGPALFAELEQAYTQGPWRQTPYVAPEQFVQQLDLLERLEHTAALAGLSERLALSLCTWLAARQAALRSAILELHHERGRHACPPTVLELAFGEPVWLMVQLVPLLRERLSRQVLAGPVVALTLRSQALAQQSARSATLFPDPLHAPADYRRLLDLLSARLGAEHVLQPAQLADHRPEIENRWLPLKASLTPEASPSLSTPASYANDPFLRERPFWLLTEPLALKVRGDRPMYEGPLHLLRGPERIESGWWDHLRIARDYFVAQDQRAVRYWIYRERDTEQARWFLHGFFG